MRCMRMHGRRHCSQEPPESCSRQNCSISERNAQIHVSVSAAEGETLFVPFVAIDGWKCIQNGKAVDIEPILGGFLGITLTEGENEVVFSFEEPGLKAGVGISILGFAFLLILFFAEAES